MPSPEQLQKMIAEQIRESRDYAEKQKQYAESEKKLDQTLRQYNERDPGIEYTNQVEKPQAEMASIVLQQQQYAAQRAGALEAMARSKQSQANLLFEAAADIRKLWGIIVDEYREARPGYIQRAQHDAHVKERERHNSSQWEKQVAKQEPSTGTADGGGSPQRGFR
jgi:hypothetical protein